MLPDNPARHEPLTSETAWLIGAFVGRRFRLRRFDTGTLSGKFTSGNCRVPRTSLQLHGNVSRAAGQAYSATTSGFNAGRIVGALALNGARAFVPGFAKSATREMDTSGFPDVVLNGDEAIWRAFLSGYNEADGLKAGNWDLRLPQF